MRVASWVPVVRGALVVVSGRLATTRGEREIVASSVSISGTGPVPKPVGCSNRNAGGGSTAAGAGLENVGLLARLWGRVVEAGEGYLTLDDGSGRPIKALTYAPISQNDYALLTGVLGIEQDAAPGSPANVVLRVRDGFDVQVLSAGGLLAEGRPASSSPPVENPAKRPLSGSQPAAHLSLTRPAGWTARSADYTRTRDLLRSAGTSCDWVPLYAEVLGPPDSDAVEVRVYDCTGKGLEEAVASVGGDAASITRDYEANKARAMSRGRADLPPSPYLVTQTWLRLGSDEALMVQNACIGEPTAALYVKKADELIAVSARGTCLEEARSLLRAVVPDIPGR
jgi:hypothetical protein